MGMKVLFAVDLTEPHAVIRRVEEFARALGGELLVLHVRQSAPSAPVPPVDPMSGLMGFAPYSVYDPEIEADFERAEEDAFREFLRNRFSGPVRAAIREGEPAETVLKDADEEHADLIVLGKRHQSRFEEFLMGSVVDQVLRHASRPVLLVPIPRDEEPGSRT